LNGNPDWEVFFDRKIPRQRKGGTSLLKKHKAEDKTAVERLRFLNSQRLFFAISDRNILYWDSD
jgi:hypothetical protein